ncbi:class I SAM-dependent methyltransferase [Cohnella sp. GbtcB17]|uniref:class I SAM-dependent methyltransferase n=1 Tax=Cohnella sp. GbtcB17 TaxID=2824762 RepID=UPI001C2FF56A|nr:class I SAM-dependent methyltransferase [Cohnella sp. GbtcB17]
MNSEIIAANIHVHSIMADHYNKEPHFLPENQSKVKSNLIELSSMGNERLLDLGCGTGFIINLAVDLFDEIHGVDVTKAMLDKIDLSTGNIKLHNIPAESLPFENDYFDLVTAYSFIHHLEDYNPVLKEAYRVLKPGGQFYIDLEPNKLFWNAIKALPEDGVLTPIVEREVKSVLHTDSSVQEHFGIDTEVFNKAEYIKNILGGIDPFAFQKDCLTAGFTACQINFEWFLGQGSVTRQMGNSAADEIIQYLRELGPLGNNLFKYLRFNMVK